MHQAATWARVIIPPSRDMILPTQKIADSLAARCDFGEQSQSIIGLAVEELINVVLYYSFDDGKITDGEITIEFRIEPPFLQINVTELGLPFDLSMVPELHGKAYLDNDSTLAGLGVHLLKHNADHFRIINNGTKGVRLEIAWFLPGDHIDDLHEKSPSAEIERVPSEEEEEIRILDDTFAIQIARLVYRGYGYSYVYADIYYPDRVCAYFHSGLLKSCGAVTPSGQLVGHLALMKESAESNALEWGVAVVHPQWRGRGLMESMLRTAMDCAAERQESILFAHAVTAHPYTQKACLRFGFQPVALLLGFAPATMKFKGISNDLKQRESTFLAVRCTHPLPPKKLYLPGRHEQVLRRLLAVLDPPLPEEYLLQSHEGSNFWRNKTDYAASTAPCINVGRIQVAAVGNDFDQVLWRETIRLCRLGVDVIYLTLDLADPGTARMISHAEQCGFFLAGLTPMMLPAYGLTLQRLNCCEVDFSAIHTCGQLAEWLKEQVEREHRRIEAVNTLPICPA